MPVHRRCSQICPGLPGSLDVSSCQHDVSDLSEITSDSQQVGQDYEWQSKDADHKGARTLARRLCDSARHRPHMARFVKTTNADSVSAMMAIER